MLLVFLFCLSVNFLFLVQSIFEFVCADEHGMLQIWDVRREQCVHAQQLRKAPLLKLKYTHAI